MDAPPADLESLLDRLKGAQHALIEDAARHPGLPSTAMIRKIAELENMIAAVLALIEERQSSQDPRDARRVAALGELGHPWRPSAQVRS